VAAQEAVRHVRECSASWAGCPERQPWAATFAQVLNECSVSGQRGISRRYLKKCSPCKTGARWIEPQPGTPGQKLRAETYPLSADLGLVLIMAAQPFER
jgi:hypothetical protein